MKPSTRCYSALVLSAGTIGAAIIGSAGAANWSLWPGQTGQPASVAAAPAATGNAPVQLVANDRHYGDGSYTGPVVDAYWGPIQVQANVRGGRVASVDVLQYPADRRASQRINTQALPMLEREVISAQNTAVNVISGATLTSNAYLRSLNTALAQAAS